MSVPPVRWGRFYIVLGMGNASRGKTCKTRKEHEMNDLSKLILSAVKSLNALNQAQMRRFLFETGLTPSQDIVQTVADLREAGLLAQIANNMGIQYVLTDKGEAALSADPLPADLLAKLAHEAEEYRQLFAVEQEFLATYSEQASGAIPVFLSIRQQEKVLFKIQVIVHDVETAKALQQNWRAHAPEIFAGTWSLMAPGIDQPHFE